MLLLLLVPPLLLCFLWHLLLLLSLMLLLLLCSLLEPPLLLLLPLQKSPTSAVLYSQAGAAGMVPAGQVWVEPLGPEAYLLLPTLLA